jgi:hypothetical protein
LAEVLPDGDTIRSHGEALITELQHKFEYETFHPKHNKRYYREKYSELRELFFYHTGFYPEQVWPVENCSVNPDSF